MCVAGSKKQRNVNLESIVMRCGYIISLMLISINYISKQTICVSHAKNIERQETHLRNLLLLFFFFVKITTLSSPILFQKLVW